MHVSLHLSSSGTKDLVFLAHPRRERIVLLPFSKLRVRSFLPSTPRGLGVAAPPAPTASASPVVGMSVVFVTSRLSCDPFFPVTLTRLPAPFFLRWNGATERMIMFLS